MSQIRQLAAIMFTDIVGYTALMGSDEKKAFELLDKNRKLQNPIIEEFHGRNIKELGDGILTSFSTVSDAVSAALKIQEICRQTDEFSLRIGIHQGEVVLEGDDVFGDAVNIASRLQSVAEPGTIYVSESVYQNISNKTQFPVRFVKQEFLKNVKEPVNIYKVLTGAAPGWNYKLTSEKSPEKSIAVLPFVNMSNDPEQEYFSDGMAEEILNALSHLKELKVAGRTSAFQFKGKNTDLREVGSKLGVSTVLEGSVRKQGNRLRITAQLINVENGFHIWSEKYDRDLNDVFAIQDEIAMAITDKLKLTLFEKDRAVITKTSTHSTEAYDLYLKGHYYLWQYTPESFEKAMACFEQAIKLDPDFGSPYAGLALCYNGAAWWEYMDPKDAFVKAKEWAERAIRVDKSLAEAYNNLGYIETHAWNWQAAEQHFKQAILLKPNFADAHLFYGWLLGTLDRIDEADHEMRLAQELDPQSVVIAANASFPYYWRRQFLETAEKATEALKVDPTNQVVYFFLGLSYAMAAHFEKAIAAFQQAIRYSGNSLYFKGWLAHALASAGQKNNALEILQELETSTTPQRTFSYQIALIYLGLGEHDKAMDLIETAFRERSPFMVYLKIEPYLDPLRENPRFRKLLATMKLD